MIDQSRNMLLKDFTEEELRQLESLHCMHVKRYRKTEIIFREDEKLRDVAVVLEGLVFIEKIDRFGNKTILASISAGQVFGETSASLGIPRMVYAVAGEDARILFLDLPTVLSYEFAASSWNQKLLRSLLTVSTQRNMILQTRIFCTNSNRIRDRIQTFLQGYSVQYGSTEFDIPFSRQEMADFLNVERSALSRELGRMREEGILTFRRNHFHLLTERPDAPKKKNKR